MPDTVNKNKGSSIALSLINRNAAVKCPERVNFCECHYSIVRLNIATVLSLLFPIVAILIFIDWAIDSVSLCKRMI